MPFFRKVQTLAGLLVLGLVAGCAPLPEFGSLSESRPSPPPSLMPTDELLAAVAAAPVAQARGQNLSSRAARLKARAALMRGPVNDPATRARLLAAIDAGQA